MKKIEGNLQIVDAKKNEITFFVQKNQQNSLKGLVWGSVAMTFTALALPLTAYTTAAVVATPFVGSIIPSSGAPLLVAAVVATVAIDYLAIKCTGICARNALYHFGPEYQLVKKA